MDKDFELLIGPAESHLASIEEALNRKPSESELELIEGQLRQMRTVLDEATACAGPLFEPRIKNLEERWLCACTESVLLSNEPPPFDELRPDSRD
jgi:hypothetical protein